MLKSRKFYAVLALMLALAMAFSVTAFADGAASINVSNSSANTEATLNWPTEVCVVTVSGLVEDDNVSIVVYDGRVASLTGLTASNIFYVKQGVANASGVVQFSFIMKSGNYAPFASYTGGTDDIKVAVGNDGGVIETAQYTVVNLLLADEIESIEVTPTTFLQVGDVRTDLTGNVVVTYAGGGTGTINLSDSSIVSLGDFSTSAVNPRLSLSPSINLANEEDPFVGDPFEISVVTNKMDYCTVNFKAKSDSDTILYTKGVDNGKNLVLPPYPSYTKAGYDKTYQCVGWSDGTSLYKAGRPLTITESKDFYGVWVDLKLEDGCSLRTDDKTDDLDTNLRTSGIRWTTTINKTLYNDLQSKASYVYTGVVALPNSVLALPKYSLGDDEEHFTMDSIDASDGEGFDYFESNNLPRYYEIISRSLVEKEQTEYDQFVNSDSVYSFNVAIVNLADPSGILRKHSARSFIRIYYADGTDDIFYSAYNTTKNTRSAKGVAEKVRDEYSGFGGYSTDKKNIINHYANTVKSAS